jgi:signal transduction histidine kinase/CheY-like chemotaxis protein
LAVAGWAVGSSSAAAAVDEAWRSRFVMGYHADVNRGLGAAQRKAQAALQAATTSADLPTQVQAAAQFFMSAPPALARDHCPTFSRYAAIARNERRIDERDWFDLAVTAAPHWLDKPCPGQASLAELEALAMRLGDPARMYYVRAVQVEKAWNAGQWNDATELLTRQLETAITGHQRAQTMLAVADLDRVAAGESSRAREWIASARQEFEDDDYPALALLCDANLALVALGSGDTRAGLAAMKKAVAAMRRDLIFPGTAGSLLMELAHALNGIDRPRDALALIAESDRFKLDDTRWQLRRARTLLASYALLGTPDAYALGEREIQRIRQLMASSPGGQPSLSVMRAIAPFYERFGRFEAALEAQKQLVSVMEEAQRRNSETARVEIQARLDLALKDQENAQLKADAELQAERQRGWIVAFAIAAAGVAAAGTALAVAVRRGRRLARVSAELAQRNGELEQRSASRIRLLAAACHDLRQPAHALGMLAELGSDAQQEPSRFSAWLQSVRRSTASLGEMLDELMDLGRLDGGHYTPLLSEVPLGELMQEVMLHFGPLAHRKGLTLQAPPVDVLVTTDRHLLRRILFNVVSNAIKYTDRGGVQVSIVPLGEQVRLSVQDSGPGIPPDKIDDVFRDYVRLNPTKAAEGLGIGLSIVRRAAELLGHELTLKSEPGQGTRVSLMLPLSAQAHEPAPAGEELWAAADGAVVAVVENDVDVRDAMAALLTSWGYRVCAGADAPTVMAHAAEQAVQPQLIITDLHLDNTDGLTEVARLREGLGMPSLPALLVTGDLDGAITGQAALAGVYVAHKPLAPRKLAALVRQLIGAPVDTGMAARAAVNAEGR